MVLISDGVSRDPEQTHCTVRRQRSLGHYQERYGVSDDFIERGTMLATLDNLSIMLNDSEHAFGHGYCLAAALLGIDRELRRR